ncbi:MAG: ExbD/TolR family protein [Kingella sp. (in: b-proteobacteria)]
MAFVSMGENDDDAPMSDINVTPLVDVMLVLMIVFMITMPVLTHSIQINLPTTNNTQSQNTPKQETKPIDVAVQVSGKYVLGADSTQQLDLQEVKQKLKTIAQNDSEAVLAIDADKDVAYEHVANLLDAASEAKISKVGFRMEVQNKK